MLVTIVHSISLEVIDQASVYIKHVIKTQKNVISFIADKRGDSYLIKQNNKKKNGVFSLNSQFKMVRELFGSLVVQYLGIKGHRVCLIPAGMPYPGKQYAALLATLHSIVPGSSLSKSYKRLYRNVFIKQWSLGRGRKLKNCGLSLEVIHSMAMHSMLPDIVALDTYIGNNDRSRSNLFEHNNILYVIDMDCSLSYNLAYLACCQLITLKNNNCLNPPELAALKHYRYALERYVKKCRIENLRALFDNACAQAGFIEGGVFAQGLHLVHKHRQILEENYQSVLELIEVLRSFEDDYSVQNALPYALHKI